MIFWIIIIYSSRSRNSFLPEVIQLCLVFNMVKQKKMDLFIFYVSVAITRSHVIVETRVKRIVSDGYNLTDDYHPLPSFPVPPRSLIN